VNTKKIIESNKKRRYNIYHRVKNRIRVIKIRQENPDYTLQKIGNIVNLSQPAVSKYLKQAGLPTRNIGKTYFHAGKPEFRRQLLEARQKFFKISEKRRITSNQRKIKVCKLRQENPDYTQREIGELVMISRSMVGRILKEADLPTMTNRYKERDYMKNPKMTIMKKSIKNREKIHKMCQENPSYTLKEIRNTVNLPPDRVRQIIRELIILGK
tara:strand:+ start:554 stop:1192 length:639 start_codon:yes stop_codon:yes gene_type:complete